MADFSWIHPLSLVSCSVSPFTAPVGCVLLYADDRDLAAGWSRYF